LCLDVETQPLIVVHQHSAVELVKCLSSLGKDSPTLEQFQKRFVYLSCIFTIKGEIKKRPGIKELNIHPHAHIDSKSYYHVIITL